MHHDVMGTSDSDPSTENNPMDPGTEAHKLRKEDAAGLVRYELYLDPHGHRIRGVKLDVYGSPTVLATAAAVGEMTMHTTPDEARQRLRRRGCACVPEALSGAELDHCLKAMRSALRAARSVATATVHDGGRAGDSGGDAALQPQPDLIPSM
jgi:hypothetical protein